MCGCPSQEAGRRTDDGPWCQTQNSVLSLTDQVTLSRKVLFSSPSLICKMGVTALSWGHGKNWELPNVNKVSGPLPVLSKWKLLNGSSLQLTGTFKSLWAWAPICVLRTPKMQVSRAPWLSWHHLMESTWGLWCDAEPGGCPLWLHFREAGREALWG